MLKMRCNTFLRSKLALQSRQVVRDSYSFLNLIRNIWLQAVVELRGPLWLVLISFDQFPLWSQSFHVGQWKSWNMHREGSSLESQLWDIHILCWSFSLAARMQKEERPTAVPTHWLPHSANAALGWHYRQHVCHAQPCLLHLGTGRLYSKLVRSACLL